MSEATLALLAAAARLGWYAGGLGAAGLAWVALLAPTPAQAAWLRSWCRRAALLAAAAGLLGFAAQYALLAGGGPLLDAELAAMALAAPGGVALGIGLAGCLLLAAGGAIPRAAGGLLFCVSLAVAGYAAARGPAAAALVFLHAAAAAAWIGSLPLLHRLAAHGEAGFLAAWGRAALPGIALLLASGVGLAAWLTGGPAGLIGSPYGRAVLAKLALVVAMLAVGARHRLRLVPALAARQPGAAARLARSIRLQGALALLVLGLVAGLAGGIFGRPPGGVPALWAIPPGQALL